MAYLLELLKALLYGIIFAATEWLPAGSEAHVLMLEGVLPFELYTEPEMNRNFLNLFVPVLQLAAAGSAGALFFRRLWPFSKRKSPERKRAILRVWLLTLIPATLFLTGAVLFLKKAASFISSPAVIAVITILCGAALILGERFVVRPHVFELKEMTLKETGIAGLAQLLSIIPGVSHSGTAILGGRLAGMNRTTAAEFMCCLAIPSLLGTALIKLAGVQVQLSLQAVPLLLAGICGVFLSTVFTVRSLVNYLRSGGLHLFGYYRIIAGLVLLILAVLGVFPEGVIL